MWTATTSTASTVKVTGASMRSFVPSVTVIAVPAFKTIWPWQAKAITVLHERRARFIRGPKVALPSPFRHLPPATFGPAYRRQAP